MSQPKRKVIRYKGCLDCLLYYYPNGKDGEAYHFDASNKYMVKAGDYDRLKADYAAIAAENERLREEASEVESQNEHAISRIRRLEAENERLRKAGDAMRDCVDSDTFPNIIAAWNAAKEGRNAK